MVRWAARAIPADYGRFAPWVFDAASDGDDLACQLLDETCQQLATLLEGMRQLGADRIALLGGIGMRLAPRLAHLPLVSPGADALEGPSCLPDRRPTHVCIPEPVPIHPTPKCGPDPGLPAAGGAHVSPAAPGRG